MSTQNSRWIIIQLPQPVRNILEQLEKNAENCMNVMASRYMELHLLIISSLSIHWSGYIEFLGTKLDSLVMAHRLFEIR